LVALLLGTPRIRIAALLVIALPGGASAVLWHREWTQKFDGPISVAIVQGAVPQDQKWSVAWRDKTLDLYRELAQPHFGARLIVWPEAALPDLSYQLTDYLSRLWRDARDSGSDILMGLLRYDPRADAYYNGVLALADQPEWYHKRRLVPFGEFFPVPDFIRSWLRLMNLPYSDITPGAPNQAPLSAAGQKIGTTICYEDSYGAEQLAVLREATLLVNVTNDAWFGDTSAAYQHLEISRMRALEAGRPMLRAANDGVSAIIDDLGKVSSTLPRFKADVLTGNVQPRTGLTPYARVGNAPVVLLAFFGATLAAAIRFNELHKKSN
jgi:apolipoprotein N-acyltransferase